MSEELKYAIPASLMNSIYLALFNRQKIRKSGIFISTDTDYEVTYCLAELDRITEDFKRNLIFGEHKHIDTRTMADFDTSQSEIGEGEIMSNECGGILDDGGYKIGDRVGLSWIRGHGNAKVVGVYQDFYMVIRNCNDNTPTVVHKSKLVPPEPVKVDASPIFVDDVKNIIINDIQTNGPIRKTIEGMFPSDAPIEKL